MFQCFAIKYILVSIPHSTYMTPWKIRYNLLMGEKIQPCSLISQLFPLNFTIAFAGSVLSMDISIQSVGIPYMWGKNPTVLLLWVYSALPWQLQGMVVQYSWDFSWLLFLVSFPAGKETKAVCQQVCSGCSSSGSMTQVTRRISVKHWTFICLSSETRLFCRLPSRLRMTVLFTPLKMKI